jgi:hypothetical protein
MDNIKSIDDNESTTTIIKDTFKMILNVKALLFLPLNVAVAFTLAFLTADLTKVCLRFKKNRLFSNRYLNIIVLL